ncbi:MAG: cell envelope integrity protein TolA [Candidatus Berkiella sp.]
MQKGPSQKISLGLAVCLHIALGILLVISFDHTLHLPPMATPDENKEIIEAVVINKKSLQDEVDRLAMIEAKKKQQEQAKKQELIRKETEAKQKREKEEQLLLELKRKNEQLKKEAELQRLVKEQQEQELKDKVKAEQEQIKKLQKQKDELQAAKNKAIVEQKAAELAKQQELAKQKAQELADQQAKAASVNRAQLDQYKMLLRNRLHQHWRQPLGVDFSKYSCKIAVSLLPTGEVLSVRIAESSGSVEFDRSAVLAVEKASPLPMPPDPALASQFREFDFIFRPEAA